MKILILIIYILKSCGFIRDSFMFICESYTFIGKNFELPVSDSGDIKIYDFVNIMFIVISFSIL